jgi:hypothetical protein
MRKQLIAVPQRESRQTVFDAAATKLFDGAKLSLVARDN